MSTTFIGGFSARHIPSLFIATTFTLGGLLPFWDPARAMREYGFPGHVADARAARSPFAAYGSRTTMIGVLMWACYARRDLVFLDTILSSLLVAGVADGYLCWREGVPGRGVFRFACSVALGGWGLLGLTSG
ncbi:hypothetical protein N3K66_002849 [Trichothecium roseum]|uniref:Uncharacterized protein n=1 Tax=Trichothecium roseum TaxID=47278 RepID=A0ACC0V4E9_9HYPO|nr:hypothetical protein N3K66_002849 [Trichothecium roseum]